MGGAGPPYRPREAPLWVPQGGRHVGGAGTEILQFVACHLLEVDGQLGVSGGRFRGLASLDSSWRRVAVGTADGDATAFLLRGWTA